MFVVPKSEITLGGVRFYGTNSGVNAVEIQQSVDAIGGTAKITIPRNFRRKDDKGILDCIHVGDKATIRLGYNEKIETEFIGYVSAIGDGTPIVVELEDEIYQLKKEKAQNHNFLGTQSVQDVLRHVLSSYLVDNNICVPLSSGYVLKDKTVYQVVNDIREKYGFCIKIDYKTKAVNCFWPYDFQGFSTHTYVFGTKDCTQLEQLRDRNLSPNIAKNDLKFTRKEDLKLQITAKAIDRSGKKLSVTIGSDESTASKRTLNFGCEVQTESELKARADSELKKHCYDGYTGKITGFGLPRTKAGDVLKLVDAANAEREGSYLIKSVKITYSLSGGFRRENELSYKI